MRARFTAAVLVLSASLAACSAASLPPAVPRVVSSGKPQVLVVIDDSGLVSEVAADALGVMTGASSSAYVFGTPQARTMESVLARIDALKPSAVVVNVGEDTGEYGTLEDDFIAFITRLRATTSRLIFLGPPSAESFVAARTSYPSSSLRRLARADQLARHLCGAFDGEFESLEKTVGAVLRRDVRTRQAFHAAQVEALTSALEPRTERCPPTDRPTPISGDS